ncbi:DUF2304 domain-containing protein [Nocardioides sp. 616]|uniref:DUF2304 domain-containing protein n=1 Tax=Nocardioides sp. 616 TaxID=2268090 RepID=UPI000CE53E1C|nr:DUF2304 domain-containing protein [Nocardioides sp. 616]
MILVQLILIAAFGFLFVVALRSRSAHSVAAWKKLFFTLLMVVVVIAVLTPALVSRVANAVGVGRGTDLVLYMVAVAFGFYVVNGYLAAQSTRNELHRLARRLAILEALERYGLERTSARDREFVAQGPAAPAPEVPTPGTTETASAARTPAGDA